MNDVISKAKTELHDIEQRVRVLLARKDKLTNFISTYAELFGPQAALDVRAPDPKASRGAKQPPAKVIILSAVSDILMDGHRRSTRTLLDLLGHRDIKVGGKDKLLALSALLSRDERFETDRKIGWSLVDTQKVRPEPAATGSGLFTSSGTPPDPMP